ncbi:MAG: hypothetical protein ACJAQ3_001643 [Planctomycetota bacterium]|jgi:hypothetical protein
MKPTPIIQDAQQLDLFIGNDRPFIGQGNGIGNGRPERLLQEGKHESRQPKLASPPHELELRPGRRIRVARQVSSSLYIFQGFEMQRESASSAPAQLAEGAATSSAIVSGIVSGIASGIASGSLAESIPDKSHKTKQHRSTPRHATPRRVKRVVKSRMLASSAPLAKQLPPVTAAALDVATRRSPSPAGLSSAALSYVFVAVTLACTFLV